MRFANTVVIVGFERLRFLSGASEKNASVSLSKELRTQFVNSVYQLPPPPGLKI